MMGLWGAKISTRDFQQVKMGCCERDPMMKDLGVYSRQGARQRPWLAWRQGGEKGVAVVLYPENAQQPLARLLVWGGTLSLGKEEGGTNPKWLESTSRGS